MYVHFVICRFIELFMTNDNNLTADVLIDFTIIMNIVYLDNPISEDWVLLYISGASIDGELFGRVCALT